MQNTPKDKQQKNHSNDAPQADEAAILARANFERVVGEVLLFLSAIPPYDEMFLEQVPDRIIRPLVLKQFEIARSEEGVIVGYRSWALATDELAKRLESNDETLTLSKDDWNSGKIKIIIDEIGMLPKDKENLQTLN